MTRHEPSSPTTSYWHRWVIRDGSTGNYVAGYTTGHGPTRVMKHNPANAVCHAGHSNGVVTLWSPAGGKALVSMLCHRSPVSDLAVDKSGTYMATAGFDGYLKVCAAPLCRYIVRGLKRPQVLLPIP